MLFAVAGIHLLMFARSTPVRRAEHASGKVLAGYVALPACALAGFVLAAGFVRRADEVLQR